MSAQTAVIPKHYLPQHLLLSYFVFKVMLYGTIVDDFATTIFSAEQRSNIGAMLQPFDAIVATISCNITFGKRRREDLES